MADILRVRNADGTWSAIPAIIGPKGDTGNDGVSATHSWNGTKLTVTSASGTSSADLKGDKGDPGDAIPVQSNAPTDYSLWFDTVSKSLRYKNPDTGFWENISSGFAPQIVVSCQTGSTVTCRKGDTILTADEVDGKWTFNVTEYGEWTVVASLGKASNSTTVQVYAVCQMPIEIAVEYATIFVTGLDESSTVSATKDGKTVVGKWVTKANPAVVVPDGYTQLEYIESTGTQHINTDVIGKNGTEVIADLQLANANNCYLFGYAGDTTNRFAAFYWHGKYGIDCVNANGYYTSITDINRHTISIKGNTINIDGASTSAGIPATYNSPYPMFVFARSFDASGANSFASMKLFSMQIKDNGALIRDFLPCVDPDGNIGLYDLVTKAFFGNAGTGTFVAGEEIPATVEGFAVEPITDYGTWTVTATDGSTTKTQDVLVEEAVEHSIEMG